MDAAAAVRADRLEDLLFSRSVESLVVPISLRCQIVNEDKNPNPTDLDPSDKV